MKKLSVVSDVDLGFGSPQTVTVSKFISSVLETTAHVIYPIVPDRRAPNAHDDIRATGIQTRDHPWTPGGRIEFLGRAGKVINAEPPDVLIINNYLMLPILDLLDKPPSLVIHLALEEPPSFSDVFLEGVQSEEIHRLSKKIDFWIFPETNRAIRATRQFKISSQQQSVVYNLDPEIPKQGGVPPIHPVSPRIIYAGTLDVVNSVAKHFLSNVFHGIPIDVFGRWQGPAKQLEVFRPMISNATTGPTYFGEVTHRELRALLPTYAFSLVYWLPTNFATVNAAPNKFFQAIAAGVPVICAPHPQCVELVDRYKCGIVADDWSLLALRSSINYALSIFDTPQYHNLLEGCRRAVEEELNWPTQFGKLSKQLQLGRPESA